MKPLTLRAHFIGPALLGWFALLATACSRDDGPPPVAASPSPSPSPERDPLAEAHFRRAEIKFQQGLLAESLRELDQVIALEPDHGPAYLLRGRAHFLRAEYPLATAALTRARAIDGHSLEQLYLLGESLLQRRQYADAEAAYLELLEIDPRFRDAAKRLALLYASSEQHDKAMPALLRAREIAPQDVDVLLQLGITLRNRNDIAGSRAALEQARRLEPKGARTAYELGMTLKRVDDGLARAQFEAALAIDPIHDGALYQLSQMARGDGDPARQRDLLERYQKAHAIAERERGMRNALEYSPDRPDLLFALALLEADHRRFDEAERIFARVLLIDPKNRDAATNLGRARMRLGRARDAVAPLERAAELEPTVARHRLELAEALLLAGDQPPGIEAIERARSLIAPGTGSEPMAERLAVAQLYERAHRAEEADRAYGEILALDPTNGDAFAGRGLVRARAHHDPEPAIEDLEAAQRLGSGRQAEVERMLATLAAAR